MHLGQTTNHMSALLEQSRDDIKLQNLNEEAEYKRGVARSENGRQETDCSKIQKCLRASCTMNTHYTHTLLYTHRTF